MRPTRLEIEGFASFRARTVLDLRDAELFVLFGPTGAGKSSLIDAMVFALYGIVPRYDDKRLVAPVISQGLNEARIRLDFTADGRTYTAVRVVQRTKTGATTKEARLETGDRTLAASADELTQEVTRLLGLSFEHFTRCVVLPQGAFAQFLHAKVAERQDLLVKLLGVELYESIRERAGQQGRELEARAGLIQERLAGELAAATEDALARADARVETLRELLARIEAARPELEALSARHGEAGAKAAEAEAKAARLKDVTPPAGLDALVDRLAAAETTARNAESSLDAAVKAREAAESTRAALPERAALEAASRIRTELASAETRLERGAAERVRAAVAAEQAAAAVVEAEAALREADDALEAIKRERAAEHLARHLVVGESCPVCLQTVEALPDHAAPRERDDAQRRRTDVEATLRDARAASSKAATALAAREADHTNAVAQRDRLAAEAKALPSADEVTRLEGAITAADAALAEARNVETRVRKERKAALDAAAALDGERARAWKIFDAARDGLAAAGLAPPPAGRSDLRADWRALNEWAAARLPEEAERARAARADAEEARTRFEWKVEELRAECAQRQVDASSGDPRDACTHALADARVTAQRLQSDVETAKAWRAEHAVVEAEARTAKDLARHLDARNFERWLMTRALSRLVAGATRVLRELSGGAYSLELGSTNDFLVIDHRNADERRMARTLSGGETFLASLALALALAEHVAEMAVGGTARLEALFLDEGFGTLDADTLDTVATAIEELGSRGRMVGLVTHVRDLAERVPVRFDVRKVGASSEVVRVTAAV